MQATTNLSLLLKTMEPKLNPDIFVFVFVSILNHAVLEPTQILASIREPEGVSIVVEEAVAQSMGLTILFCCAWISSTVHSALEAVGLTVVFWSALGDIGISCNVVAGAHHDHIFVPVDKGSMAMNAIQTLQLRSKSISPAKVAMNADRRYSATPGFVLVNEKLMCCF